MITVYYDITGHIIDDKFIVTGDKAKPALDLNFEICGNTLVINGLEEYIAEWNSRFNFTALSDTEGKRLVAIFFIESSKPVE